MADQGRRAETKTDDFEQLRELNNHAARQEARNTDVPVTQRRGRNLGKKKLEFEFKIALTIALAGWEAGGVVAVLCLLHHAHLTWPQHSILERIALHDYLPN